MKKLEKQLTEKGYKVLTYQHKPGNLQKKTDEFKQWVKDNNLSNFSVVGYSTGGIFGSMAIAKGLEGVDKMIALASPFGGISKGTIADLGTDPAARDMQNAETMKGIKDNINTFIKSPENKIQFFSLFSTTDSLVSQESASLGEGATNIPLQGIKTDPRGRYHMTNEHLGFPTYQQTIDKV